MSIRKYTASALGGLALLAAGACGGTTDSVDSAVAPTIQPPAATNPPGETSTAPPLPTTEPEIPVELQNAIDSARSYVQLAGFSKTGLIEQLSSQYGDGYPADVATKAVERLDVDWKAEAVESAESYMSMTSFSRSGLIEQLTSEYGEGFTQSQAEYAVSEVF